MLDDPERLGIAMNDRTTADDILKSVQDATTPQDREELLERTRSLGYEARQQMLAAETHEGEAAVVAEPLESALWFVELPPDFLSDPEVRREIVELAQRAGSEAIKAYLEAEAAVRTNGAGPTLPER